MMKLKELLEACNLEQMSAYTKLLVLSDGMWDVANVDIGVDYMIDTFMEISPSYMLSSKFKLFISSDPLGAMWALENKEFKGTPSGKTGMLGSCNVDDFRFFNILLVPWSELLSMECDFSTEFNGGFLEYILPWLFFDLAAGGFDEPSGKEVDEKVNNLLGIS
jgi:hypothetical protein